MTEEEKNIEWICSRTLLDKNDELVPIILKMLSETYINGLKQGHFDRDMDMQKQQEEIKYWKNGFERELENNRSNTTELLKQDIELRKKDKIIDEMAIYIHSKQLLIDKNFNVLTEKYIIQYFKKKVEEK